MGICASKPEPAAQQVNNVVSQRAQHPSSNGREQGQGVVPPPEKQKVTSTGTGTADGNSGLKVSRGQQKVPNTVTATPSATDKQISPTITTTTTTTNNNNNNNATINTTVSRPQGNRHTSVATMTTGLGSIPSRPAVVTAASTQTADQVSKINMEDSRELKVLLLGAGESGKSTIMKQLKIIHQNGFSEEELYSYVPIIYGNIIDIGKDIIRARAQFNLPLDNGLTSQEINRLLAYNLGEDEEVATGPKTKNDDGNGGSSSSTSTTSSSSSGNVVALAVPDQDIRNNDNTTGTDGPILPREFYSTLTKLWSSKLTQNLINSNKSSSFYLMDSTSYFLNPANLNRILNTQDYKPTLQDVLRSRQKTSGIFDTHIQMGSDMKLHFFDVGGQRSERKKWIYCFDNVTLVIFCVSLSEYDQFLLEDKAQNRFQESLILFENVVNSRWFSRTSVVLFLNKIDLFAEKLKTKPLKNYFPDYTGGDDINKATKYILWRFVKLNRANLSIYPHVTQATDTSNIRLVFAAIKETVLENALRDTGVLPGVR